MTLKLSLQSLFAEVLSFVRKDFHKSSYIYTFALIIGLTIINYSTGFYRDIMKPTYASGNSMWAYPLFYGVMYFVVAIPTLLFQKEYQLLRNKRFYLKSIFFIGFYGVSIGYFGYRNWEFSGFSDQEKLLALKFISQLKGAFLYIIPIWILKKTVDKNVEGIYGLARSSKHINAYLMLFLMLLPFLIMVSFTPDFLSAYPQFRPWLFEGSFGLPTWFFTPVYELGYAIDFLKTELVFRGMLIIGMISIMDRKAILPMVAMYVAIHFGKPLGETISSIFGGYILGALAYQTRHIWGGVIVHICIAMTMEIMGFLQYYTLK